VRLEQMVRALVWAGLRLLAVPEIRHLGSPAPS
jgi:hypothetical protein